MKNKSRDPNAKESIDKENFIAFLAAMKPEEINKLIEDKGKPPKKISPIFFYPSNDK